MQLQAQGQKGLTRAGVERLSADELRAYLTDRLQLEVSVDSLAALEENRVSGRTFLELREEDLKELFPLIGERRAVERLIGSYRPNEVNLTCRVCTGAITVIFGQG